MQLLYEDLVIFPKIELYRKSSSPGYINILYLLGDPNTIGVRCLWSTLSAFFIAAKTRMKSRMEGKIVGLSKAPRSALSVESLANKSRLRAKLRNQLILLFFPVIVGFSLPSTPFLHGVHINHFFAIFPFSVDGELGWQMVLKWWSLPAHFHLLHIWWLSGSALSIDDSFLTSQLPAGWLVGR